MAHTMSANGATDLIKPDHTTILLGFMVHNIGRFIFVVMFKKKMGMR